MTEGWHCATRVVFHAADLAPWLAGQPGDAAVVVVDPALAAGDITARVLDAVEATGRTAVVHVPPRPAGGDGPHRFDALVELVDGATTGGRPPALVAVGGGTVIDQAKLVALAHRSPDARARVLASQRSGLVLVPMDMTPRLALAAVPTTLGTGAELSGSACVEHPRGKRLVVGEGLRPALAVVDARATATLPAFLVAEGVVEALFRVTGMYAGDARDLPVEDHLALALAAALVGAGHRVATEWSRTGAVGAELRLEVAKLSGLTQSGWLTVGRNRYAAKGWYVATELSWVASCRKVTAIAAVLPALWAAIDGGDERWGSPARLRALWHRLRRAAAVALPAAPGPGIAALLDHWGIERPPPAGPDERLEVARRAVRRWGAGLPMLAGLRAGDVADLLAGEAGDARGTGHLARSG